jgi:hypothetical protein
MALAANVLPEEGRSRRRLGARDAAMASGFGLLAFALYRVLAQLFYDMRAFEDINLFFENDANIGLGRFADPAYGINMVHPLLTVFTQPFASVTAKLAQWLGLTHADDRVARELVALNFAPAFAALQVATGFLTVRRLGLAPAPAMLVATLSVAAFAQILYGMVPSHYPMTGFLLAVAFYLAVRALDDPRLGSVLVWLPLACLLTGTTITNAALITVVLLVLRLHQGAPPVRAVGEASLVGAASIAIVAAPVLAWQLVQGKTGAAADRTERFVLVFLQTDIADLVERLLGLPATLWHAFVATGVTILDYPPALLTHIMFDFARPPSLQDSIGGLLVLALLLLPLLVIRGLDRHWRLVVWSGWGVVLFNLLFHTAWGDQPFLYVLHWQPATVLLLAATLALGGRPTRVAGALLLGLTLLAVAANIGTLLLMLSTLWPLVPPAA